LASCFPDSLCGPINKIVGTSSQVRSLLAFDDQFKTLPISLNPTHVEAIIEIQSGS
jgi:hypothetical protein